MNRYSKTAATVLSVALSLVCMAGCQSTAQVPDKVADIASLEGAISAEQLETFSQIYSSEHQEDWVAVIGEDGALMNEQSLVDAYILQEVLPANGQELYMEWRNIAHP